MFTLWPKLMLVFSLNYGCQAWKGLNKTKQNSRVKLLLVKIKKTRMYLDLGSCLKGGKPTLLTPPSTLEINALLNTVWRREHQHCTVPHFTHEKSMYSSYKPILTSVLHLCVEERRPTCMCSYPTQTLLGVTRLKSMHLSRKPSLQAYRTWIRV